MRRSYLVVEGPHDVEFVARMLPRGFSRVHKLADLDAGPRVLGTAAIASSVATMTTGRVRRGE